MAIRFLYLWVSLGIVPPLIWWWAMGDFGPAVPVWLARLVVLGVPPLLTVGAGVLNASLSD
jgi:hypothetical protein